jgi:hypothetical protein
MRFLHVSKDDTVLNKDSFCKPKIHRRGGWSTHDFNMDNALYLSQAYEDGNSDWLSFCKWSQKPRPFVSKTDSKGKFVQLPNTDDEYNDTDNKWVSSKNHFFFDVDFDRHKIYVIDSVDQLKDFFIKYSVFHQRPIHYYPNDHYYSKIPNIDNRYKFYKMIQVLIDFITNLSPAHRALLDNVSVVNHVKAIRNRRNMSLIKLKKNVVPIPKKGITFEFLIDVVRTIEYYDNIVGDTSEIYTRTSIRGIDFPKLVKEGYNGIYYSRNIIKQNSEPYDSNIPHCDNYVAKIDIGEFPDVIGDTTIEDTRQMKYDIENYIRWLGSDTMILWNWIFD